MYTNGIIPGFSGNVVYRFLPLPPPKKWPPQKKNTHTHTACLTPHEFPGKSPQILFAYCWQQYHCPPISGEGEPEHLLVEVVYCGLVARVFGDLPVALHGVELHMSQQMSLSLLIFFMHGSGIALHPRPPKVPRQLPRRRTSSSLQKVSHYMGSVAGTHASVALHCATMCCRV